MKTFNGELAKASSLMLISTVGGGFLGYVFQVQMGRELSVGDYGLFVTLMASLAIVGVPLGTLSMVISRRASDYRARGQASQIAGMFWWINRYVFWIALGVVISALPFTRYFQAYAQLESLLPVFIFLALIFTMPFCPVNVAFLQAQQNFRWLAVHGLAAQGFKLIFCLILVSAGLRLNGALLGMVLAAMSTWLLTYLPLRSLVSGPFGEDRSENHLSFKGTIPVLFANLSFAVFTQLDLVIVSNYYDSQQAGVYAAAAILGKAVLYLPTAVTIAMFPMVAENESRTQSSLYLLLTAMLFTLILSGSGAAFYFFFADEILNMFYGQKYTGAAELLRLYGLAMVPLALALVAEHFFIAKGRVIFAYVMLLGIPFTLLSIHNYHEEIICMVYILILGGWGIVLIGFGLVGGQVFAGKLKRYTGSS